MVLRFLPSFVLFLWFIITLDAQKINAKVPSQYALANETPSPVVGRGKGFVQAGHSFSKAKLLTSQVPQYLTEGKAVYHQGGVNPGALGKNLFQYTLMIGGIGAAASVLDNYSKTGDFKPSSALNFLTDDGFLKSSMGIFAGATMLSMAGSFLPPGIPLVLKTFPGFLGASLGFEWSQGNLKSVNLTKAIIGSLASAAAFVTLGSGGVLAIGGGILASMASDAIFDRFVEVASYEANIKQPSFEEWAPNDTAKQSADQAWPDENQIILERTLFRTMEKSILENNLLEFQRLQRQLKPEN